MRLGPLLLVIVISTSAIGFLEIRHQAEREAWRAETSRLSDDLDRTRRLAEQRAEALSTRDRQDWRTEEAAAELADLEARILDAAADLALLETERAVAQDRADAALHDLKKQVRVLTKIEGDMIAISGRRQRLEDHVDAVEDRLQQAEAGAAERQKRAEALDRDIAGLAIRKETLLASLKAAETTKAERALAEIVSDKPETVASPPPEPPEAEPIAIPAAISTPIIDTVVTEPEDRVRGLYQFGSLSADPADAGDNRQDDPPTSEGLSEGTPSEDDAAGWAQDQYLLGLELLSSAEANSGTRELNEAILAFKAVLGEWPRQSDPKRWAIARSDLGYALALLGKRQGNAAVLEQAAAACREALSELKQDETPLLWAAAQHHLGVSLGGLAQVHGDQSLREESIDALEQAIAVFKDAGAETDARKAERRLHETHAGLPAASGN